MPTPAERRRAKLRADASLLTEAAVKLIDHRETGFGGLRPDEADAMAALMEVLADTARDDSCNWRTWEAARRTAEAILAPEPKTGPGWLPAAARPGATRGMPTSTDAGSWRKASQPPSASPSSIPRRRSR